MNPKPKLIIDYLKNISSIAGSPPPPPPRLGANLKDGISVPKLRERVMSLKEGNIIRLLGTGVVCDEDIIRRSESLLESLPCGGGGGEKHE